MKTFTKKSMISLIIVFTMIFNLVPFGALTVYSKVEVKSILEDDFENYDVNTTISSGKTPYTVKYDGSGNENQKIITSEQKDGSTGKVLQLQGVSGWASEIQYSFTPDDRQYLVFETDIKPVSGSSPGGIMICSSKADGYWTHSVCRSFLENNKFYYGKNDSTTDTNSELRYSNGNWYHLKLVLDRTNNFQYIIIDDSLIGKYTADPATPEWMELNAGNAGTNTMYFDNIKLYSTNTFEIHSHTLTLVPAKTATCSLTGNNAYYTCSGCKKVFTDTLGTVETTVEAQKIAINPSAHDWNSGIVTTPATCTAEGVKTYTCNHNHEHTKTEPVDKIEHSLEHVKELAATCTADGNDEYYKCSVCDKYFTDALGTLEIADKSSVVRTATGHDWGEWLETTPATVDNEGVKTRICKNDSSHKETATIDRLPYAILEGDSQTFVIDSSKDIIIRANGTFDKFLGLKMDGKDIESKYYTAVSGSTVVTLAQEYMDTLDEGEHTLTFVYTDGTVDSTLKIAKVSTPEEINNNQTNTETTNTSSSPKTGDNIIIWISLLVISALGIMLTIRFIKRKS